MVKFKLLFLNILLIINNFSFMIIISLNYNLLIPNLDQVQANVNKIILLYQYYSVIKINFQFLLKFIFFFIYLNFILIIFNIVFKKLKNFFINNSNRLT